MRKLWKHSVTNCCCCLTTWLGLLLFVGCTDDSGSSPTQDALPTGHIPPVATDDLLVADHPEYVNWNRFSVGTAVVRSKEVTNDFGTVRVTTTLRLAEKMADKVVV